MDINNMLLNIDTKISITLNSNNKQINNNNNNNNKITDNLIYKNNESTYKIGPICQFVINTTATVSIISDVYYFYNKKSINKTIYQGKILNKYINIKELIIILTNQNFIYIIYSILYISELDINILSTNKLNGVTVFNNNSVSLFKNTRCTIKGYKSNLYITKTKILYSIYNYNNNNKLLIYNKNNNNNNYIYNNIYNNKNI